MASSIELTLLSPFIKRNRDNDSWFLIPSKQNLYCITIVVDNANDIFKENLYLNLFELVKNRSYLPCQDIIYSWENGNTAEPSCIYFATSIIRCQRCLKNPNEIMASVKHDERYVSLIDKMSSFVPETTSLAHIANIMLQILEVLISHLGKVDNIPLGIVVNSVSYFDGDLERQQERSICLNTKNVDFRYDLMVL